MHALSNYNNSNILIATPESDLSADQQALNANFKTIVTGFVPYTGATEDVNLGTHSLTAATAYVENLNPDNTPLTIGNTSTGSATSATVTVYNLESPSSNFVTVASFNGNSSLGGPGAIEIGVLDTGEGAYMSIQAVGLGEGALILRGGILAMDNVAGGLAAAVVFTTADTSIISSISGGTDGASSWVQEISTTGPDLCYNAVSGNHYFQDTSTPTANPGNIFSGTVVLNPATLPASPVAGQIAFDGTHFQGVQRDGLGGAWMTRA
jgi:hypothetical protein